MNVLAGADAGSDESNDVDLMGGDIDIGLEIALGHQNHQGLIGDFNRELNESIQNNTNISSSSKCEHRKMDKKPFPPPPAPPTSPEVHHIQSNGHSLLEDMDSMMDSNKDVSNHPLDCFFPGNFNSHSPPKHINHISNSNMNEFFCSGSPPNAAFSSPDPPPSTPTNEHSEHHHPNPNNCMSLMKFEFPELPKLRCNTDLSEPVNNGLKSFMEQFKNSTNNLCRALIPYEQNNLHSKLKSSSSTYRYNKYSRLNFRKEYDEKRLRIAANMGDIQAVKKLIGLGVDPNTSDDMGRTSLHLSSCKGYTEIVEILLQGGANPNKKDAIGNTALHLASCTNHFKVVTLLLRAGTDVTTLDNYGRCPLDLAKSKLKLLASNKYNSGDSLRVKNEISSIVEMMQEYLAKIKKGNDMESELLNEFANRLSLDVSAEQVEDDVKILLNNLSSLKIEHPLPLQLQLQQETPSTSTSSSSNSENSKLSSSLQTHQLLNNSFFQITSNSNQPGTSQNSLNLNLFSSTPTPQSQSDSFLPKQNPFLVNTDKSRSKF